MDVFGYLRFLAQTFKAQPPVCLSLFLSSKSILKCFGVEN